MAFPLGPSLKTYYVNARTDASGNFDVDHGIDTHADEGVMILGAVVSVQNSNDAWYTVFATGDGSRIAWRDRTVSGRMPDPHFANQDVRILLWTIDQP